MCAFVCLYGIGDGALASEMIGRIAHRGPDALDVRRLDDAPIVMAHCRLSIIGTEDGAQPIYQAPDILVVNGEMYNHADLRAILGESAFETRSDSETILHLFRSTGCAGSRAWTGCLRSCWRRPTGSSRPATRSASSRSSWRRSATAWSSPRSSMRSTGSASARSRRSLRAPAAPALRPAGLHPGQRRRWEAARIAI